MSRGVPLTFLLCAAAAVVAGLIWQAAGRAPAAGDTTACAARSDSGSSQTGGSGALMRTAGLEELASGSARIVAGTVASFRTCLDPELQAPVTSVTLVVERELKGAAGASTVSFDVPGGRLGDAIMAYGTSPDFTAGEEVIVFLHELPDGSLRLVAGFQGKLRVVDGVVERAGLPLEDFVAAVRDAVDGGLLAANDPLAAGEAGVVEAAYTLMAYKWYTFPIGYYINPSDAKPAQLDTSNVRTAWDNAFSTWENDPKSSVDFSALGETSRTSDSDACNGGHPGDGYNDITWGISLGEDGFTLATTYTCALANQIPYELRDADIEFTAVQAGGSWRTDGTGTCGSGQHDIESVALHEIGHLLGLDHPGNTNCPVSQCPVMNPSYVGVKRTPCQDDADGVASLYPAGATPAPTNTQAPTNTPTSTRTATNTPLATNTSTATSAPASTDTPTATASPTTTDTPLSTNTPTVPPASTDTPTSVATVSPTATPTSTSPAAPTSTPTRTSTSTPTRTRTPTPSKPLGDVNDDGLVNSVDSLLVLQYSAELLHTLPNAASADVNDNGAIDAIDSALILQYSAGLLHQFPAGHAAGTNWARWLERF